MKKQFTLLLSTLLLTSCMDIGELDDVRIKVDTSTPIGSLNFTDETLFALSDLDDVLTVGKDGVLEIDFSDNLSLIGSDNLSDFFTFPDQNHTYGIATNIPTPPVVAPGSTVTIPSSDPISDKVALNMPSGDIIENILFANGSVLIKFDEVANVNGVRWRIPELRLPNGNMVSGIFNQAVQLDGCSLTPIINGANNELTLELYGEIPIINQINGTLTISSSKFKSVSGFLARKEIAIEPISVNLGSGFSDFNKHVEQAYFVNPQVKLDINSDFDLPMLVSIESVKIDGHKLELTDQVAKTNFLVKKGKTTITLDNSTSSTPNGLSELIGVSTQHIEVKLGAVMNPSQSAGDPTDGGNDLNTINATDALAAKYTTTIPLDGYLKNIKFEEKIGNFDISNEELDLQSMVMAISGENKMPIEISIMAYAGSIAPGNEIFDKPIIIPASKSQNQPTIVGKENLGVAKIDKVAIDKLKAGKMLIFQFTASTRNIGKKEIVKFYSPTSINLQIMLGATGEVNL